jgi:hypothetical protein
MMRGCMSHLVTFIPTHIRTHFRPCTWFVALWKHCTQSLLKQITYANMFHTHCTYMCCAWLLRVQRDLHKKHAYRQYRQCTWFFAFRKGCSNTLDQTHRLRKRAQNNLCRHTQYMVCVHMSHLVTYCTHMHIDSTGSAHAFSHSHQSANRPVRDRRPMQTWSTHRIHTFVAHG